MFRLLLLFTLVPVGELYLLFQISRFIGPELTVGVVVVTGAVGVVLAKSQGIAALKNIQDQVAMGEVPGSAILDGLFVLVGGILLVTPGLITDFLGFALLIPFTRRPIKKYLRRKLSELIDRGDTIYIRRW